MPREAKLRCPNCGTQVTVFEDEVGKSGHCPGCGSDMEVFRQDFGSGKRDSSRGGKKSLAARVANLVGRASEKGAAPPADSDEDEETLPAAEDSDGDILSDLIEEDAEGTAAAEGALGEIEEPVRADEPAPAAADAADEEGEATADAEEPALAPAAPAGERFPQETEYRIWQGLAEEAGDRAMAARLDLWLRAEQAGCSMTLRLPGGLHVPIPQIVLAEAAAARAGDQDELAWRDGWTRRLLKMAGEWPDEDTIEGVVTVLNHTDGVVDALKDAGVWPWDVE